MATISLILSDPAAPDREAIVAVMGEVGAADRELITTAIRLVVSHAPRVVVDLSEVTAFAPAALPDLLSAHDACMAAAADLILRNPPEHLVRALQLTDAAEQFMIERARPS